MISFWISVVPPKHHRTSPVAVRSRARALAVVIQHEAVLGRLGRDNRDTRGELRPAAVDRRGPAGPARLRGRVGRPPGFGGLAARSWRNASSATRNGERQHDFAEWPPRSSTVRHGFGAGCRF